MENICNESDEIKEEFERLEQEVKTDFDSKKAEIIAINNGIQIEFNDGFLPNKESKQLEWNSTNPQNVYFLHGAFHILQKEGQIVKIKADLTSSMLKNIQEEWNKGYDSLTILESTAKNKQEEINKNLYLKHCFDNFNDQEGVLVTLGVSFYDSDGHIIDGINNNDQLNKIYIGCYEKPSEELLSKFKENSKVKYFSTRGFKPNASPNMSCRYFTASHETLLWAKKDNKEKHTFNYEAMKNGDWGKDEIKKPNKQMRSVWQIDTPKSYEKTFGKHPTQKPLELLRRIILATSDFGDLILDPFTGSSTTGIMAIELGKEYLEKVA